VLFRIFTVLAVVALGISTWILSSPAHRPRQGPQASQAELPGYYLKNAVLTDYDAAGLPTIRIEAQRIEQIAHTPAVTLFDVRVNYRASNGQNWVLFGDQAQVRPGGKIVDVAGNVRLQGERSGTSPAAVVHTDSLSYDVTDAVATTDHDVHIDFGAQRLSAHGLVVDLKERTMRLTSRVYGRFQP
jgi:lipopolysaccharide export system protein LptC